MKALLLKEPHVLEVIDMEMPEPGPGEVRVKVLCTGICGSEILAYHGRHFARKPPVVTGHEVCGLVDKLGDGVTAPAVGTRVAAMPQKSCGTCKWCQSGAPNLCGKRSMLGFPEWQGSFAEYFVIPADLLYPVEDNVSSTVGTLMEPLAVGVHAVRRVGVRPGDSIVVFGSGAVGLTCVLAASAAGAKTIIATDVFDFNLDLARSIGATHTHNARSGSAVDAVMEATGGEGALHAVMSAEAPGLVEQALHSLSIRGRLGIVASYAEATPINLQFVKSREIEILGSLTYDREDFQKAVNMASEYNDDLQKLVTHVLPLEKGAEAFALAANRTEDLVRVAFRL